MCFDKDSSLLAWTISYTIAMYLFYRNRNFDRWNAGFIICFATVQVLEAGLWSTQEDKTKGDHSSNINDLLTRLILIALVTQPLFQTYLGYTSLTKAGARGDPKGRIITDVLKFMSFIFVGVLLWSFYRIWKSKPGDFSSKPGPNGHMVWSDAKSPNFLGGTTSPLINAVYFLGLFLPLLAMIYFSLSKGGRFGGWGPVLLLLVGVFTVIYSTKVAAPNEFSSYWCFSAVLYSLAAVVV